MDGFSSHASLLPSSLTAPAAQRTLKTAIGCVGVGVHSGQRVEIAFHPAPTDTGIVFRRSDLDVAIPARFDHVIDTRLCTVLGLPDRPDARVGTVEHVMAALAGCGVTNAVVELNGPEAPILDGSAASLVFLVECAGILNQEVSAEVIEVLRPVRVGDDTAFAELLPGPAGFDLSMSIAFEAAAIGHQSLALRLSPASFRAELARARTFALAGDVARLQQAGLALGGSLDNAVVVDGACVLNPGGLRMPDEFVRHKLLDAVGDMALAGAPLCGRFVAHRSGHALNNRLLRALFADAANWRWRPGSERVAEPPRLRAARAADGGASPPNASNRQDRQLRVAAAPLA